jgi:RNA polymerase-binding transcription factor
MGAPLGATVAGGVRPARPDSVPVMDESRARELLMRERERVQRELAAIERAGRLEGSEQLEPGDRDSEDLYEDELAEGRLEDLREQLAAIERAEERLAAGTFGLSVESGEPIPDARLEAVPTAERTVEEEARRR